MRRERPGGLNGSGKRKNDVVVKVWVKEKVASALSTVHTVRSLALQLLAGWAKGRPRASVRCCLNGSDTEAISRVLSQRFR